MRLIPLVGLALLIVGCATSDRYVVKGPDGGPAVLVSCPAYESCLEEAAEGCPFGYDIVDRASRTSVSGFHGFVGTTNREQMLVRCHRRKED